MLDKDAITVQVAKKVQRAPDVYSFELVPTSGASLPEYTPGAHIDVEIEAGIVRPYSLYGDPGDRTRYCIAVKRSAESRGGSSALHSHTAVGSILRVGAPRNLFQLNSEAKPRMFLAAGIGITPIFCMTNWLFQRGEDFCLHYSARSSREAAFYEEICSSGLRGHVTFHFSKDGSSQRIDLRALEQRMRSFAEIYVCGPAGYMKDVCETAHRAGYEPANVHCELFIGEDPRVEENSSFEVELAKTGKILVVPPEHSVAEILNQNGVSVGLSCGQGLCGSCLTGVLAGQIDHRDRYLTEEERSRHDCFTPCCSRALSSRLVIDL
ncbi:vanillate O-demethylase ferredoxin subunit [Bradyrhizobium sp. AZCC 2262]|uniref:PDR/VanB family oxidoreductase n=1 Tax=Bradyrhizobium sp. AZCC 2262 TaxID=3117022 RepID=UPI002FF1B958